MIDELEKLAKAATEAKGYPQRSKACELMWNALDPEVVLKLLAVVRAADKVLINHLRDREQETCEDMSALFERFQDLKALEDLK